MALDLRGMQRREWTQFLRRESHIMAMNTLEFVGYAGLLHILEVSEPFVRKVSLADELYLAAAGAVRRPLVAHGDVRPERRVDTVLFRHHGAEFCRGFGRTDV